ncbi:MAG: hypothetical protein A3I00_01685 [Betaproteobacteria bacterium RIFCSPLOWO2_02_FULL_64_12]|nr:MAG: hypothetical protein A3I00_01685 [Betaproteobacteria bacterium RIFCSPLOWO2_02_FULL_64_12]
MEIMFFSVVCPGFLGSEEAPTTATLLGLKNALNDETSCMTFLRMAVFYSPEPGDYIVVVG